MTKQNIIVEFQRNSKRTAPFQAEPCNKQEFEWILSNYTLGLVGETLELDSVLSQHKFLDEYSSEKQLELLEEYKKESGDVWHYAVNLMTILGETFNEERLFATEISEKDIIYVAGDFSENVKKMIYHGHSLDKDKLIDILYIFVSELFDINSYNLKEILDSNINKLKIRYPQCFTVKNSIERVDVK